MLLRFQRDVQMPDDVLGRVVSTAMKADNFSGDMEKASDYIGTEMGGINS